MEDLVAKATRKQITDKGAFVKKAFSPTLDLSSLDERITSVAKQETAKKDAKQDIYYQFDEYIKTKERKVSKATYRDLFVLACLTGYVSPTSLS